MTTPDAQDAQSLWFDSFRVDSAAGRLLHGADEVKLHPKAFELLRLLAAHPGMLFSKDQLLDALWPDHVTEGVVKTTVHELRRALDAAGGDARWVATEPRRGYRFVAAVSTTGPASGGLVGRRDEVGVLAEAASRAAQGDRELVFVSGPAGIGKSALVEHLANEIAPAFGYRVARGQCLELFGTAEPYLPVFEILATLCAREPSLTAELARMAPSWAAQMPGLFEPADGGDDSASAAPLQTASEGPRRLLGSAAEWLEHAAAKTPLLLVLEDLQWSDPSTLDLVAYLARRNGPARLAMVATVRRPPQLGHDHPLRSVESELASRARCRHLELGPLTEDESVRLATRHAPELEAEAARHLHRRSGGNPLLLLGLSEKGLQSADGAFDDLPMAIRGLVQRQLDALGDEDLELLRGAAVCGRMFTCSALAAALGAPSDEPPDDVESACERLCRDGTFLLRDGSDRCGYRFRHDLYRECLYDLVPPARRQVVHRRLASYLESEAAAGMAASAPAAPALHWASAGDADRASNAFALAATLASRRFAYREVVDLASRGLDQLARLPESAQRDARELRLRTALGMGKMITAGYGHPEVEANFRRTRDLAASKSANLGVDSTRTDSLLTGALLGLWGHAFIRAQFGDAAEDARRAMAAADRTGDDALRAEARFCLGVSDMVQGRFDDGLRHLERCLELAPTDDAGRTLVRFGRDTVVVALGFAAWTRWCTGDRQAALHQSELAIARGRELGQAQSMAFALLTRSLILVLERSPRAARTHARELVALCEEHGFDLWQAYGRALGGWADALSGNLADGLRELDGGLAAIEASGARFNRPMLLGLRAEVLRQAGRDEDAQASLAEAIRTAEETGEVHYLAVLRSRRLH